MEILFVTSELAPYSRRSDASSAADVAAALPKALRGLGHKVTVVSPLYAGIDPTARSLARRLSTLTVSAMGRNHTCTLYDGRTTGGVDLIFLANAELFASRGPADGDAELQALAAVVLGGAAAQLADKREPVLDVVHVHDAGAALTLPYLKALRPELPCVLSIHDDREPGELSDALVAELELPAHVLHAFSGGAASLLVAGVHAADLVVTGASSTTLALTGRDTRLAAAVRDKGERTLGIVNGVDASIWNPLTDSLLSARFDPVNLQGKERCKGSLQYSMGLGVRPELPVIAAIGELSSARGGDLIADSAAQLLRNNAQLIVLGSDGDVAERLRALAAELPEQMVLRTSFSDKERHLTLAGADFMLLPAREPIALDIALCAMRYGTLPIVRPVGALSDMIVDADAKLETGNGFVAQEATSADVLATLQRALSSYEQHKAFTELRRRVMRTDVSWDRSARRYEYAYRQLKQAATQSAA